MSSGAMPAGVPPDARELSIDELAKIAEADQTFRPIYEQVLAARKAREASAAKPTKAVAPVASAEAKASAAGAAGSGAATPASGTEAPAGASVISSVKGGVKGLPERVSVSLGGREIYQWEQTLDEVNIYVPQPAGVPAKAIGCELEVAHIRLGINLKSPSPQVYFDEDLGGPISLDESFMTIEDGVVHVYLQKGQLGQPWPAALAAHAPAADAARDEALRQRLLLERFQRENPGFDFSGASFSGSAPDAREFLGGIDRSRLR